MHWNNCWSNSFKSLDKQFLNKTYFVDDIFSKFFYEEIFSALMKKKIKTIKDVDEKEDIETTKLKGEEVIVNDQQIYVFNLKANLKNLYKKKYRYGHYLVKLFVKTRDAFLEDKLKAEISLKKEKLLLKISKVLTEIIDLCNNVKEAKKNIKKSNSFIKSILINFENLNLKKSRLNLFSIKALKEAKKKLNYLKDETKLYKAPAPKKALKKKENYNFSRVWFIKFNKFILITMFSYFYKKIKVWKKKKRFFFKKRRLMNPAIFVFFNKRSGLNQKREIFNNFIKKDFFIF